MSLRGRVLQRTPYSPDCPASSYQDQMNQYKFLARVLHIAQYESQSWDTANGFQNDGVKIGQLVRIKDKWKDWPGRPSALALVVPVDKLLVLNMFWENAGGTVMPTGLKNGFVFKTRTDTWVDATNTWVWSGSIAASTLVMASIIATLSRPIWTVTMGDETAYEDATQSMASGVVKEIYFVCPFFEITMKGNGESCKQVLVYPK